MKCNEKFLLFIIVSLLSSLTTNAQTAKDSVLLYGGQVYDGFTEEEIEREPA